MADISDFITALEAAQAGKFTQEVQDAAKGIDVAALKTAVAEALAADETEKIADDIDPKAVTLRAGFEFAAKVVMMLKAAPGPFEKKDLYVHFKIARQEEVPTPGMFDMVKKQLYGEWLKVKHYSSHKSQALYIQHVNTFIGKYGTRDA
ncbi:hypothetical protein N7492_005289 [Penicillium capsulatum]|uniref:ACB domain-containing protein n=1 Tax=Penicillium capsulatum TaxID=69766 RepID=A0A9W9IC38_9EURO|nr:hypothetical protein N7492_005289 [Penicillium capsulatum]KAJ6135606.1 hypothetical protein N7512_000766 [Penicillium capsulatum]